MIDCGEVTEMKIIQVYHLLSVQVWILCHVTRVLVLSRPVSLGVMANFEKSLVEVDILFVLYKR